ncbi:AI-2E family transporter [Proteinivorax hydrogeniformans]|uniref:AI-2E family transporter n=1 Tax=Proteinivorax hydrogeniformans TaxID=1826727 RepID=A0AAU8HSJ7_9FIRM
MNIKSYFENKNVKLAMKITLAVLLVFFIFSLVTASVISFIALFGRTVVSLLTPLIVALIIAYILNPVVVFFQERKVPRGVSVLAIYIIIFTLLYILVARMVPIVSHEIDRLTHHLPNYTEDINEFIVDFNQQTERIELPKGLEDSIEESLEALQDALINGFARLPEFGLSLAMGLFQVFMVLVLTFYCLRDYYIFQKAFFKLLPANKRASFAKITHEIDESLGNYIRGIIIVCVMIGTTTYFGLLFLGVDYALTLGIFAGITNVIPYFGPWIGAIPATIIAFFQDPILAVKVVIVITIIQQIESQLVAPQVLGKKLKLHPVAVILSLIAGGTFFGIKGMILGVPVVAVFRIILRNIVAYIVSKQKK